MDVYVLLSVVFSIAFLAPVMQWLYIWYIKACIQHVWMALKRARRKIANRKSKFQQELEKVAQTYGVNVEDLQV